MRLFIIHTTVIALINFPLIAHGFTEPPVINISKPTPTTTYYIDASAPEGGNGGISLPWNQIKDADGKVMPGALILIKGTFTGADSIQTWNQSGTPGNEIVFEPWDGAEATITYPFGIGWNGTGNNIIFDGGPLRKIIFDGQNLQNGYNIYIYGDGITLYRIIAKDNNKNPANSSATNISGAGGNNAKIYNCEISGSYSAGIYFQGGNNVEIRNNIIHDQLGQGIQFNPHKDGYSVNGAVVSGNFVYNNGSGGKRGGIALLTAYEESLLSNIYVYNNIIWGNTTDGITLSSPSYNISDIYIYNNTSYNNGRYGITTAYPIIPLAGTVVNNIAFGNTSGQIDGTYINSSNNIITNPEFLSTDPASSGFMKLSVNSKNAIDLGLNLLGIVNEDIYGTPRPQGLNFDIGAYEYVPQTDLSGDLNSDGKLDLLDIQDCMNHILGIQTNVKADANTDGVVNILDVQLIVNAILGN